MIRTAIALACSHTLLVDAFPEEREKMSDFTQRILRQAAKEHNDDDIYRRLKKDDQYASKLDAVESFSPYA